MFTLGRYLLVPVFIFLGLLFAVVLIYLPGLKGEFQLDDFANLPILFDSISHSGFWHGVLGGNSGPLGRPLSLLSFAWQHNSWPEPYDFKCFNLALHLLNALLVFCLMRLLSPFFLSASYLRYCNIFSVFIAVIWVALPIHVSTVLYVVQRMVLLSSFFCLLGIIFYIIARHYLVLGRRNLCGTFFLLTLASGAASILSKESGLLMFAYLLCVEVILEVKAPIKNAYYKWSIYAFLAAPLLLFCVYLLHIKFYQGCSLRTFTLEERVLSEFRVLWIYVQQILLPRPSYLGLYHDAFDVSRSFFHPITTLFSCLGWLVVLSVICWSAIKKKPKIFFPLSWFIAGHLMESTVVCLEIYFEHRNYLASIGIVLLIGLLFIFLLEIVTSKLITLILCIVLVIYAGILSSVLYMQTKLWGDPLLFKYVHATERAGSLRARSLLIDYYQERGDSKAAYSVLEKIEADFPQEPSIYFTKLEFYCAYHDWVPKPDDEAYANVLKTGVFSNAVLKSLEDIIDLKAKKSCGVIDDQSLYQALALLRSNKNFKHKNYLLWRFESMMYLLSDNLNGAIHALESIEGRGFDDSLDYARFLAANNELEKALKVVAELKRQQSFGISSALNANELDHLSQVIEFEIQAKNMK